MLTGDKLETGECVGYSCGLLSEGMTICKLTNLNTLNEDIESCLGLVKSEMQQKALIMTGDVF